MQRALPLFLVLALFGFTPPAQAQELIHYWNFNSPADAGNPWPAPVAAAFGSGTIHYNFEAAYIQDYGGTAENAEDGDPAGDSFTVQGGASQVNNGRHLELHLSTVGYEDIVLAYATQSTGTGFGDQEVAYSTDGGATFSALTTLTPPGSYALRTIDLSSVEAADDNDGLVVRIALDGATSSSGNNRFDNITVVGVPAAGGPVTNVTQGTSYAAIQAAIDAANDGDLIEVAAGTFEEQLVIGRDDLTIRGAGSGSDPATNTIVRAPETLTYSFATEAHDNYPIVGIHDATGGTLEDVRVDGAGRGSGNDRFIGIGLWNAGGTVANCVATGVRETPLGGAQHGVGLYANNDTGGPYTVAVSGTAVDDFQKGGMVLAGAGLTVEVEGNTVTGAGPTDVIGQNGIQVGHGATGRIAQNDVSGIAYAGATYAAAAVLVLEADATTEVHDNTVEDAQIGLWFDNSSAEGIGNRVASPATVGAGSWGAILDPVDASRTPAPAPFDAAVHDASRAGAKASASIDYTFDDNVLVGSGAEGSIGVEIYSGSETVHVTGRGNLVKDFGTGVYVSEEAAGLVASVAFHENCIVGNAMGLANDAALTVDATGNWWGNGAGPGTSNANGVDGPVTVDPVAGGPVAGIEGCGGGSVACEASLVTETVVRNEPPGEVQFEISDPEGIQSVGFVAPEGEDPDPKHPEDWTPFLNNLTAASTAGGLVDAAGNSEAPFEAGGEPGIVWIAPDADDLPPSAAFALTQADTAVPEASYYAAVLNGCGTLTLIDPVHALAVQPEAFALEGSYPNPFRTQATLRFALPEAADVTLAVYDVMGRRVATLIDDRLTAGRHEVVWQGRGSGRPLPSGVYFVRLEAGAHAATGRLTLVR